MRKYVVRNQFHVGVGEFTTMREAVKFSIKILCDLYNDNQEYPSKQRLIKDDIYTFNSVLAALGTKFAPKPDKLISGRYVDILNFDADDTRDIKMFYF